MPCHPSTRSPAYTTASPDEIRCPTHVGELSNAARDLLRRAVLSAALQGSSGSVDVETEQGVFRCRIQRMLAPHNVLIRWDWERER